MKQLGTYPRLVTNKPKWWCRFIRKSLASPGEGVEVCGDEVFCWSKGAKFLGGMEGGKE